MPVGVIVNALSVIIGGVTGGFLAEKKKIKHMDTLMIILGICALAMGISSVVKIRNLPVVILAVILGFIIGESIKLDEIITNLFRKVLDKFGKADTDEAYMDKLLVIAVVICTSATGIYGALLSGIAQDHSILITKAILDIFTAGIFALTLSYIVALLGVIQFVILGTIFVCAKFIMPFCSEEMIMDFVACGGIIMVATGLKIAQIKDVNIANMIPALILVIPLSYIYSQFF